MKLQITVAAAWALACAAALSAQTGKPPDGFTPIFNG